MKFNTLILKIALVCMAIPVVLLCIFAIPRFAYVAANDFLALPWMQYVLMTGVYATALAYFYALWQSGKLLRYIERNEAFSNLSVLALRKIKWCRYFISFLYVLTLPVFYIIAEIDDAPGLILVGLSFIFAAAVVSIFATILEKLLHEAITIQQENELTI